MVFKNKTEEFALQYTIGAYVKLKDTLRCKDLRRELLSAANREDYLTLAKAVKEFSGGKVGRAEDAYALIDRYVQENGCSYFEVFLELVAEAGEAGFFKEKLTRERVEELARSPELDLDMDDLIGEAMKQFKGEGLKELVKGMAMQNITPTGASTLKTCEPPLTVVG